MNATLRDRLILLEQQFLIAVVAQDETALQEFSLELPQLIHHFKAVEARGDLDDDTALLLSRVSQVIKATTQCVLECEDILKDGQTGLMSYSNLPLPSDDLLEVLTSRPTYTSYRLLFSSSGSILGHNKLLDACAYRWLVQNVHNPYPTCAQLQTIGDESLTSVPQAELWFQEARDLIGWTRLSHEFFTGSLNSTIAAAKRVYLEQDNTIPFPIVLAFSRVKAFMETLFAEHPALPTQLKYSAQTVHANDSTDFANNEEVEEDTTPPPSIAGCKRKHSEDMVTSPASDVHRPLKRLRAQFLHKAYPHSEGVRPSSDTGSSFKRNTTEALIHTSAMPVTSVRLSGSSLSLGPKPSPDSLALNSTGQRQTDICSNASETVVFSDSLVSQGGERNKQISERSPLVLHEGQSNPYVDHGWCSSQGSVPTFTWPVPLSLDHPPGDSTGSSHITVSPGALVDLNVFDWNSIPNPLVEATLSTNQPVSVYVSSSDLAPLNFGLPDPLYAKQLTEKEYNPPYPLENLGSLEDFSLLQFPIPATFPPDVSTSPASFCSDNSTPEMDWSAITDFINEFTSFSPESSSAPSPSSAAPSTPENPTGSLLPPPSHEVNKPISLLDPSIPPSAFLPAEPGIFTDDASSMWSLLCGLS